MILAVLFSFIQTGEQKSNLLPPPPSLPFLHPFHSPSSILLPQFLSLPSFTTIFATVVVITVAATTTMCFEKQEILDELVRVANEAADAAAVVVNKFFGKPQSIQTADKCDGDGNIVEQSTNADCAAEDAMISVILTNFPTHLIFGEERGWIPEPRDADFVWVLDPIDGTSSFKNGVPLFGTLIALLYKSKPILGIIDQPILHMRWVGVQGRETMLNGKSVQTRSCENLCQATLYASSPLHFSDEEREHFDCLTEKVQEPMFGAECYTYGLLASGFVDLIVQSFLAPYDFLAFIPIIEGAGGVITDWAGQKLKWEASPNFIGPPYYRILAAGDEQVHQDALEYLTSA